MPGVQAPCFGILALAHFCILALSHRCIHALAHSSFDAFCIQAGVLQRPAGFDESSRRDESATSIERIVLTMLTTSAPQKAAQKPLTRKPSPRASDSELVSQSIRPLTTSAKMPNVTMMSGKVRTFAAGLMKALTTPKTTATPTNGSQPP